MCDKKTNKIILASLFPPHEFLQLPNHLGKKRKPIHQPEFYHVAWSSIIYHKNQANVGPNRPYMDGMGYTSWDVPPTSWPVENEGLAWDAQS